MYWINSSGSFPGSALWEDIFSSLPLCLTFPLSDKGTDTDGYFSVQEATWQPESRMDLMSCFHTTCSNHTACTIYFLQLVCEKIMFYSHQKWSKMLIKLQHWTTNLKAALVNLWQLGGRKTFKYTDTYTQKLHNTMIWQTLSPDIL